jgi:antitoxin VapB
MNTAIVKTDNGHQTVELPSAVWLAGDEVYAKQFGNAVVLLPKGAAWESLFESLNEFSVDFMQERVQPSYTPRSLR